MKKTLLFFAMLAIAATASAQIKITSNSNVGIGTTTPVTKFQIGNIWTFYDGSSKIIGRNTYWNGNNYVRIQQGVASHMVFDNNGAIFWQVAPSEAAGSTISSWSTVTILNNGNFGIGINNPTQKLHVVGNSFFNGNVGIGTSSPTQKLHIEGAVFINSDKPNWERAFEVKVQAKSTYGYSLYNVINSTHVYHICGEGYAWSLKAAMVGSDISFKKNITRIEEALQKILNLQGVKFQYNDDKQGDETEFHFGFIAQEVEKICPEVVKDMPDGTKAMAYTHLIAVLVEAVKEQQHIIENMQKGMGLRQGTDEIDELRQRVEHLENALMECCNTKSINVDEDNIIEKFNLSDPSHIQEENQNSVTSNALRVTEEMKLYQNAPNPFNEHTTIQCYIPQTIQKVELCIYNMQGAQLKCIPVSDRGAVSVQIQAGQLSSGVYTYLLIGDGKASEAKQMILTK